MIKELSAGLIIFRNTSDSVEYLLLQKTLCEHPHADGSTSTNNNQHQHWTFPKGHLDNGETHLEAAIRETKEEAGLDIETDFKLITDFQIESNYISRKGISKTVWYWIAEINNPNVAIKLSNSHKQYKWLKLNDALNLVKYESIKNGLIKANDYLKSLNE